VKEIGKDIQKKRGGERRRRSERKKERIRKGEEK